MVFTKDSLSSKLYDLGGDSLAKDVLIKNQFSLSDADLTRIRSMDDEFERVVNAGHAMAENGFGKELTHRNLAAIVYANWDYPNLLKSRVARIVEKQYRLLKSDRQAQYGLNIPAIQFLREEVGAYEGNLYDAIGVWPGIEISEKDWSKGVRLPLEVTKEVAYLLGIIWADGALSERSPDASHSGIYKLTVTGAQRETLLFEKGFTPGMNSVFNIDFKPRYQSIRWGPADEITSLAFNSWIRDYQGFPCPKRDVNLPEFADESLDSEFFSGIVSAMGILKSSHGDRYRYLLLSDHDELFVKGILDLAQRLGFPGAINPRGNSFQVTFWHVQVGEMVRRGLIRNPIWTQELNRYFKG